MSGTIQSAAATANRKFVIERTYQASLDELWELWTTKEGFESWWPPEGIRTEVHAIEASLNGKLRYDMIAEAPETVAAIKEMGLPVSHVEHARFSEFQPQEHLVLAIMIDFLPGVEPYESHITVDFYPSHQSVRMVVTLCPMHNEEFTRLAFETLESQIKTMDQQVQG